MPKPMSEKRPAEAGDEAVQKKLGQLKKEYDALNTEKITTAANIQNLETNLARLRATAERDYGTSDIEALQQILESRRRENEQKVTQYEQHINKIKADLSAIDKTETGES
jgi:hypothetical protein